MLDTIEEKQDALRGIARIIASADKSQLIWFEERDNVVLRVLSGDKAWTISAAKASEDPMGDCVDYLLRKMAHAAHRCPACLDPVTRAAVDPNTGAAALRAYRCSSCLHSWRDS